jgi:hypothetical protein
MHTHSDIHASSIFIYYREQGLESRGALSPIGVNQCMNRLDVLFYANRRHLRHLRCCLGAPQLRLRKRARSFISSHGGNVLILSHCAVNLTFADSPTDMSFAEKSAVLIISYPRNFIQPVNKRIYIESIANEKYAKNQPSASWVRSATHANFGTVVQHIEMRATQAPQSKKKPKPW